MNGEETGIDWKEWMRVSYLLSCVAGPANWPANRIGIHARRTVRALPVKTEEAAGRRKRKFTEV
jgi:hypothetical protein